MQMRVSTTSHRLMVVHLCRTFFLLKKFFISVCTDQFVPVGANLFFQRVKLSGPGLCVGRCNAGDCF